MRIASLLVVAFATVVVCAGCFERNELTLAADRTRATVPSTTTTTTPTTTQAPPTAVDVSDTPAETIPPPPPTTTTLPTAPLDPITQAILNFELAQATCFASPTECNPANFARGALLESTTQFLDRLIAIGGRSRARDLDPSTWLVRSIERGSTGTTATVLACHWSTAVLEVEGGVVLNDAVASYEERVDLELVDGQWLLVAKHALSRSAGVNACVPAPSVG